MRKLTVLLILALALLAAVAAGASAERSRAPSKNIVETAADAGRFDTLVSLLRSAGLAKTLARNGPFTVFAPTDAAFARVPESTLRSLGTDRAALRRVLLYHVLAGRYRKARLAGAGSVKTLAGPRLRVRRRGPGLRVQGIRVRRADVDASNGVIHVINRVLLPPRG
jgi:uncharacterized surface protein with fasciclin (FAS1) repeats